MKANYCKNFNDVIEHLKDEDFYIFGTSRYAHIFWRYCHEKGIDNRIKAFILSDGKEVKRNVPVYHGIPVRHMSWLKKNAPCCNIFLAAREIITKSELIPMMEHELDGDAYYVSNFTANTMFFRYVAHSHERISAYVETYESNCDFSCLNILDIGRTHHYKYIDRVAVGVVSDSNIFNGNVKLDALHEAQLGSYEYLHDIECSYNGNRKYRIYMAKSHVDKALKQEYDTPCTETIQVGAALTDMDISPLKDDTGDNISYRNRDYCEMSAVYWAWKNDRESDYIGLCHYRRRFVIDENIMNHIIAEDYDAVYTIPKLTDGGMREEFVERNYYLTPEAWDLVGKAIGKISPEYLEAWEEYGRSYFLISCNMSIMRRDIFDDYCGWVFRIMEEVDRFYLDQGVQCNNRYLGYIAECLNTVYVMKHKDDLKKAYVELKMLETI